MLARGVVKENSYWKSDALVTKLLQARSSRPITARQLWSAFRGFTFATIHFLKKFVRPKSENARRTNRVRRLERREICVRRAETITQLVPESLPTVIERLSGAPPGGGDGVAADEPEAVEAQLADATARRC